MIDGKYLTLKEVYEMLAIPYEESRLFNMTFEEIQKLTPEQLAKIKEDDRLGWDCIDSKDDDYIHIDFNLNDGPLNISFLKDEG